MKVQDLTQGSPEWAAYRARHFNASDAPAMMGCSPYKTRADLLREMHTGVIGDVDIATQKRFDNGHRAESLARPLAEKIIGQDLYPVTGSIQVAGLSRGLSASFDGLTLIEDEGWEHKALAEAIRAAFQAMSRAEHLPRDPDGARLLPIYHRVQMEQQLLVSSAERILFMASEWTADGELIEERHCWYYSDAELRQQILDGWAQFEKDLAAYVLPEAAEPAPVGKAPETLPALLIEVTGQVTASNLAEFKATALAAIQSVNRTLKTDQDFADAAKAVKWCSDVEDRLQAAKQHALSQTASIDALFRAIDDISAEARRVRLDLDKLVTRRKTEVKEEAVAAARVLLDKHIAALNAEIAPMRLQPVAVDFAGAIKGLRSFDSMQTQLDAALAAAKIAADNQARGIRMNVAVFKVATGDDTTLRALFADLGTIVHKAADDFALVVQSRIKAHHEAEAEKEARRKAEEAQRIAEAEACARAEEAARILAQQAAQAPAPAPVVPTPAPAPIAAPAPILAAVAPIPAPALRPDEPATLKLGEICAMFGPGFTMTAAFVEALGVKHSATDKAAKLYRPSDVPRICAALQRLAGRVAAGELAEVA